MFRSYVFRFGVGSSFSRLELPVLWNSPERGDRWFVVFKPPGFSLERTEGGGKERPSVQEVFEPLIPSKSQMLFPLHLDPDVEGLVPVALDTVMYEQIRKDIARGATRIRYRLLVHSSKDDPGLAELATSLLSPDAPPELEAEQRASAAGEERGATWKEEERGRCTACRSGEADTLERGGGMRPEDGVGLAGHVQGWTKMEGDGDGDGRMEENLYAGPSLLSAESLRFLGTEGVCLPGGGGASPGSFARSLHWPAAVRNSVNLGISAFRARQLLGQGGVPVVSVEGNKSEEEGREEWDGVLDVKCWRSNPGMRGPGETLLTHAERERKGGRRETRQDLASGVEAQRLAEECEALVFGRSRKGRGKGATRKDGKGRIQMEPLAARGVESENRDGSSATQDESHTPSNGTPEPVSVSSLLRFLRNESLPPSLSPFLVKRKQRSPGEAVLPLSPFPPALADLASRLLEDTEGTREGKTTKDHFEKGTAQVFREASQDPSADLEHCPSLPSVAFRVLAVTHAQPSQIPTDNTEGLPNRHSHSDPLLQGVSLEDDRRSRKRGRRKVVSKKETASLLYFERERQDTPPLPSTKHPDGSLPPALYDPPPPPDEKPPMAVLELESLDGSADLKTTEIEATFAACGFPIVRAGELSPRDSTSGPNHSLGMRTLERLRGPSWTQPSENEEYLDLMDLPVEGRNGALQVQLCELEIGDPLHPADRRPRVLLRLGFPALWQNVMEV